MWKTIYSDLLVQIAMLFGGKTKIKFFHKLLQSGQKNPSALLNPRDLYQYQAFLLLYSSVYNATPFANLFQNKARCHLYWFFYHFGVKIAKTDMNGIGLNLNYVGDMPENNTTMFFSSTKHHHHLRFLLLLCLDGLIRTACSVTKSDFFFAMAIANAQCCCPSR